jgi:hypothetical protein
MLNKILQPKWLIGILIILYLGYMIVTNKINADMFIPIVSMVVGYYFGSSETEAKSKKIE